MNKKKIGILISALGIILVVAAIAIVIFTNIPKEPKGEEITYKTFAEWTESEPLSEVPALYGGGAIVGESFDNGTKNDTIVVNSTTIENYQSYVNLLKKAGFEKFVDNGEDGFDNSLYSTILKKEELVVTIMFAEKTGETFVSAEYNQPLSEHLFYDKSYVKGNKKDAKTTFHMLELHDLGNSFLFQLKNGHFIISDGGRKTDLPYLLDYLESLTPEGEKPVIEGWFFTHSHVDHTGVLSGLMSDAQAASRIYVNGIYFNLPGKAAFAKDPTSRPSSQYIDFAAMALKTVDGEKPGVYRTTAGQRYYFNDLTIDIMMSQELVSPTEFHTDINETSTWCMVNLEGQKVMMVGDASRGSMANVLRVYSPMYLSMDVMTAMHHGSDTWNDFTDFSSVKTVLIPRHVFVESPANLYLKEKAEEVMIYGDGSKVLTFPYTVGTAVTLPHMEWIYH